MTAYDGGNGGSCRPCEAGLAVPVGCDRVEDPDIIISQALVGGDGAGSLGEGYGHDESPERLRWCGVCLSGLKYTYAGVSLS